MAIRCILIFAEAFFLLISHAKGLGYNRLFRYTTLKICSIWRKGGKWSHETKLQSFWYKKFRLTLETNGKKQTRVEYEQSLRQHWH